jgi:hypothetical protein
VVTNYLAQQLLERFAREQERAGGAAADAVPSSPDFVCSMKRIHQLVEKNRMQLGTWSVARVEQLTGEHLQIYNALMALTQAAVLDGATRADFWALGLPVQVADLLEPLRGQVAQCVEARRTRAWARDLDVHIFCALPARVAEDRPAQR